MRTLCSEGYCTFSFHNITNTCQYHYKFHTLLTLKWGNSYWRPQSVSEFKTLFNKTLPYHSVTLLVTISMWNCKEEVVNPLLTSDDTLGELSFSPDFGNLALWCLSSLTQLDHQRRGRNGFQQLRMIKCTYMAYQLFSNFMLPFWIFLHFTLHLPTSTETELAMPDQNQSSSKTFLLSLSLTCLILQ